MDYGKPALYMEAFVQYSIFYDDYKPINKSLKQIIYSVTLHRIIFTYSKLQLEARAKMLKVLLPTGFTYFR